MNQKLLLTLFALLMTVFCTYAQQSQTVNVSQAGTLASLLGSNKTTISDLTLTGTINATDFATIKQMTALKNLDLLNVDIDNGTIPASAFANKVMDKLVLPKSLLKIGDNAFSGMSIPSLDFSRCSNLEDIGVKVFFDTKVANGTLDLNNNTNLKTFKAAYRSGTFSNFNGHVVLPSNLLNLTTNTFFEFKGTVELPSVLETIGTSAFALANLSSGLNFPSTLKKIENLAFQETVIPSFDFSTCPNLEELAENVFYKTKVANGTLDFNNNTNLKTFKAAYRSGTFSNFNGHVVLPSNLLNLTTNTFFEFKGTVELPSVLETIGTSAFALANLPSGLNFPSTLKKIENLAFQETVIPSFDFSTCPNLEELAENVFYKTKVANGTLDFNNNTNLKTFKAAYRSGTFSNFNGHVVLPSNLLNLTTNTFFEFKGTVELPSVLETIGTSAFALANLPSGLNFPSTLKKIENLAFQETVIPSFDFSTCPNLEELGEKVFYYTKVANDTLDFRKNNKLKTFRSAYQTGTFSYFTGFVYLPLYLTTLPVNTFYNFRGNLELSADLEKIEAQAFGHSTIGEISLPQTVKFIGNNAFSGCNQLTKIISNNATPPSLGSTVFNGVDVENCSLTVPDRGLESYATANQWKDFINTLRSASGVSAIEAGLGETETNISIYPNPTTDVLNVKGDNIESIKVYGADGRVVKSATNTNSVDVQDLSAGFYIVKITTPSGTVTERVMKK